MTHLNQTFRVVQEVKDDQASYGFEGICTRVKGQLLTLMGAAGKRDKLETLIINREHCSVVDKKSPKLRELFTFKCASFVKKVRMLGRCGITDVECSAPFEKVLVATPLEGSHITLWLVILEETFPEVVGYSLTSFTSSSVRGTMKRKCSPVSGWSVSGGRPSAGPGCTCSPFSALSVKLTLTATGRC